jgi:hypothetical protein
MILNYCGDVLDKGSFGSVNKFEIDDLQLLVLTILIDVYFSLRSSIIKLKCKFCGSNSNAFLKHVNALV